MSLYIMNPSSWLFNAHVKRAKYSQGVVSFILLIWASCQSGNAFRDHHLQQVWEAADQRNAESLLPFLNDSDPSIRQRAAEGFASFHDTTLCDTLIAAFRVEKDPSVKAKLAFSIGQNPNKKAISNWLQKGMEWNQPWTADCYEAAGKAGLTDRIKEACASGLHPSDAARAWFFAARTGAIRDSTCFPIILKGLDSEQESCRFYTLQTLLRSKYKAPSAASQIENVWTHSSQTETKMACIQVGASCASQPLSYIQTKWNTNEAAADYLLRIACLRAASRLPDSLALPFVWNACTDAHDQVRSLASELLRFKSGFASDGALLDRYKKENIPVIKNRIAALYLQQCMDLTARNTMLEGLHKRYKATSDPYEKAGILKALLMDSEGFAFLRFEISHTEHILIREFAFEALLDLHQSAIYPNYRKQWESENAKSLEAQYAELIEEALKSEDVSMLGLVCPFIREAVVARAGDFPGLELRSPQLLSEAMQGMQLPRDIETYNELGQTIAALSNSPWEPAKPAFNHPIDWKRLERIPEDQHIRIRTAKGDIVLELWVDRAPATVAWFVQLIQEDFYRNKRLHRVVPGFVIQDGCPRGDGFGSTGASIRSEFSKSPFEAGTLGMASAGPDTESCQWFITHTATPHLEGRYTAFGRVVEGMEVVHRLNYADAIHQILLEAP